MATFKDLLDKCVSQCAYDWSLKDNKIYISTNSPYIDTDVFPRSIMTEACEEAYQYWKRDVEDTARYGCNGVKKLINAYDKEKENEMKELLRIVRKEVDDMAERYGLSMSTEYNYASDKMMVTCGKVTRARVLSDKIFIHNLRVKTAGEVLEIIERWLVDEFDINPDRNPVLVPAIKNVIHNDPATIVFWADNSKTVVKCQDGDIYDPEKGLAMAISKKAFGNRGNYCEVFKKWLPEEEEVVVTFDDLMDGIKKASEQINDYFNLNTFSKEEIKDNLGEE